MADAALQKDATEQGEPKMRWVSRAAYLQLREILQRRPSLFAWEIAEEMGEPPEIVSPLVDHLYAEGFLARVAASDETCGEGFAFSLKGPGGGELAEALRVEFVGQRLVFSLDTIFAFGDWVRGESVAMGQLEGLVYEISVLDGKSVFYGLSIAREDFLPTFKGPELELLRRNSHRIYFNDLLAEGNTRLKEFEGPERGWEAWLKGPSHGAMRLEAGTSPRGVLAQAIEKARRVGDRPWVIDLYELQTIQAAGGLAADLTDPSFWYLEGALSQMVPADGERFIFD